MVYTRPLRESDKDDILEIARNTWDGHDYLPHYFDEWLKDKTCHTLAIEQDGHIAALANLRLIDEGTTGWMEGLRVHPNYRGKGYASILTDKLIEMAYEIGAKRIRFTTDSQNEHSLHLAFKSGMKKLQSFGVYWHEDIRKIEWSFPSSKIIAINPIAEFKAIAESGLVPNGVVVVDWKAYDATIGMGDAPMGLYKLGEAEFWANRNEKGVNALSIGIVRYDMHEPTWAFTILAKNPNLFFEHFSFHIQEAKKRGYSQIMVTYGMQFREALNSLDWINRELGEMEVVLLERIL
ncbi:MAG: GNAT family N-acetyltransferase [Candidatus Thorarchaeota archaeon]